MVNYCEDTVKKALKESPFSREYIIGYGTNDLALHADLGEAVKKIIGNLYLGLKNLYEKEVYILGVPDLRYGDFKDSDELKQRRAYCNRNLYEFCRKNNATFIDLKGLLNEEDFFDSLHPNNNGARKIAGWVHGALNLFTNTGQIKP